MSEMGTERERGWPVRKHFGGGAESRFVESMIVHICSYVVFVNVSHHENTMRRMSVYIVMPTLLVSRASLVSRCAHVHPMRSGSSSPVQDADPIPHGLPIRFSDLSVPVPTSLQAGNEQLVSTLASSLWDVSSLGPIRRLVQRVASRHQHDTDHAGRFNSHHKTKYSLKSIDGVVEQVESMHELFEPQLDWPKTKRAKECIIDVLQMIIRLENIRPNSLDARPSAHRASMSNSQDSNHRSPSSICSQTRTHDCGLDQR